MFVRLIHTEKKRQDTRLFQSQSETIAEFLTKRLIPLTDSLINKSYQDSRRKIFPDYGDNDVFIRRRVQTDIIYL